MEYSAAFAPSVPRSIVTLFHRFGRPARSFPVLGLLLLGCGGGGGAPAREDGGGAGALAREVRDAVTAQELETHTRVITQNTRASGGPGENAAIDYVVAELEAAGVPTEVHTFDALLSNPVSARVEVPAAGLTLEGITFSFSASADRLPGRLVDVGGLLDLPQLEVGTGELLLMVGEGTPDGPRLDRVPDVEGAWVLLDGQARNVPVAVLEKLGAAGAIFVNPEERMNDLIVTSTWGIPSLLSYHRLPTLPVAHVPRSGGEVLRSLLAAGPVEVQVTTVVETTWAPLRLAVARIPGPTDDAPYVLFGGHIDGWHYGANDEGASNAAMLALTKAFHARRDSMQRGLVVAWWPGHSNARYAGSTWFADHFFEELRDRAVAYVNIDGIGQSEANRYSANTTSGMAPLATEVLRERTGEEVGASRPGRNSDQSFNGIGMPLLQLNHGGPYGWWHTPDDVVERVDFVTLKSDTDLYADALSHMLSDPVFPVDLAAEVEGLGQALTAHEENVGDRFDLSGARRLHDTLMALAQDIQGALPEGVGSPELDRALIGFLRPLHRVLYVPVTPYHPDSGAEGMPLPGLAPSRVLRQETPGTDRYRYAEASLVRERNRMMEALQEAVDRGRAIQAGLADGRLP